MSRISFLILSLILRLRRLCREDSGVFLKIRECDFFDKRGYPATVVQAGYYRAQQIDRQSALKAYQKEKKDRISYTLTFRLQGRETRCAKLRRQVASSALLPRQVAAQDTCSGHVSEFGRGEM